jgi:hypothetical protein
MCAASHSSQSGLGYLSPAIEGWAGKEIRMRTIRFLLALLILAIPAAAFGQIGIGIRVAIGPPELPVYEQPICPGDGFLWTPGYWAYDESISDYYWVPGTWVQAPEVGFLWTPGYWGWGEGGYFFNEGYWGENVGFYGGINYGFGYGGDGYRGGRWTNGHFFYNTSVNRVDVVNIHNVYNERIEVNNENHVSFNGGRGGIEARPTAEQQRFQSERHVPAVAAQKDHAQAARANPEQRATVNHGKPAIAATAKPGDFSQHGEAAAKGNEEAPKAESPKAESPKAEAPKAESPAAATETHNVVHPKDLAPIARPAPVNSGNAKADQKYEQQQDKLIAKQNQDRQALQQKQEAEHQRNANADNAKLEQKHQQQTQNLAQKHTAQQQSLQARAPQPRASAQPHQK